MCSFPQTWIKHLRFDLRFFKQNKPNSLIKWLYFHQTLWMLFFFEGWTKHDLVLLLFLLFRLKLGIGYENLCYWYDSSKRLFFFGRENLSSKQNHCVDSKKERQHKIHITKIMWPATNSSLDWLKVISLFGLKIVWNGFLKREEDDLTQIVISLKLYASHQWFERSWSSK